MKRTSGFALILCLLLAALLIVVVLGMLGSRGPGQEAAASARLHLQACALAQSGLEDTRVKLGKDLKFPPPPSPGQPVYSYSEAVYDVDDTLVGYYYVKIDQELNQAPYYVHRITCLGSLGEPATPLAQVTLREEVDTCPYDRTNPAQPNPRRFQVLVREELP